MSILGPSLYRSSIKSQHQQVHLDRPGSQGMGRSGNGPERPDVHGNARHSAWSPELNNFQFLCHEFCFERFKEFLNISRWALREGRGRGWLASCGKTCLKRTLESGAVKSAPPPHTHTPPPDKDCCPEFSASEEPQELRGRDPHISAQGEASAVASRRKRYLSRRKDNDGPACH